MNLSVSRYPFLSRWAVVVTLWDHQKSKLNIEYLQLPRNTPWLYSRARGSRVVVEPQPQNPLPTLRYGSCCTCIPHLPPFSSGRLYPAVGVGHFDVVVFPVRHGSRNSALSTCQLRPTLACMGCQRKTNKSPRNLFFFVCRRKTSTSGLDAISTLYLSILQLCVQMYQKGSLAVCRIRLMACVTALPTQLTSTLR